MYKNQVTTWIKDDVLDSIYEDLRKKHYIKTGHRLYKNYSEYHIQEVSAKSIYWGHSGEPEIIASILTRPCWPAGIFRILNRLWKPAMLTNPIFEISEGFVKLIEDQISWCEIRKAKGAFMSRQGDTAWREWAIHELQNKTDLKFYLPPQKFLTCATEEHNDCWQKIMYCGDESELDNWKKKEVPVKQGLRLLDMTDFKQLKELVDSKSNIKEIVADNLSDILQYRARWIEGMQTYYLVDGSKTHYLYGWYIDGILISCMGWRCDLPAPYNDGWVVGNLKSRPGYTVKTNGILELWNKMFEICEGKGLTKWHMVIPVSNSRRYQLVADRYFKEIDSSYEYEWSIIIPPNERPTQDWVWGSIGRIKLNTEIRVRTGTKRASMLYQNSN